MTESYAVAARLTMTSNVPEVLAQMVRGFGDVNKLLKETQESLSRFTADLRSLASGSRGIGRLVEGMEKIASIRPNGAMLTEMNSMAAAAREMATFTKETARASREIASAGNRSVTRGRATHGSLVDAGMGLGIAGDAGTGFLEQSIKAELEVQKYLAAFRQNNSVTAADISTIRSKAESLVRSVPGTTVAENLHTILDAYTVVGDLGEALAGSGALSKLNLLLRSLPGAHSGDPGFAAAQAMELMQRFYNPQTHQVDINALNQQVGAIAQVAAGTGGRMGPEAYLAFTKQARAASMVASDKFLYQDSPAAMIAMGGSRFGTGMAALFTQLQTGTMTKNTAEALKGAGLLDRNAVWKGGRVQDIGRHLHGADTAATNLFDWVREQILGPNGELARRHIDPSNRVAVARYLSTQTGRQTGLGVLLEAVLGMGGIDKEAAKLANQNSNPLAVLQANDPNMKVKEFHAAENELMVQLGSALLGPAIEGMKALTTGLRELTDWAKANPTAARDIAIVAGGMTLLAKAAGDVAMVIFVGAPLIGGMKALGGALSPFSGGAAEGALVKLAGASGLGALSSGIVGLGAAVVGTVGLIQGFKALNSWLGLHPGKGNGPDAPPSPSGNYTMDSLKNWWNRFSAPQENPSTNAHGGVGRHPASYYTAPGASLGAQPIQVHSVINLDGRKVASSVSYHLGKMYDGPNTGTTGPDPRATYRGSTTQWGA